MYLSACRWHKGSKLFSNNCNIQTKNFQRISIIADLIILYIIICRIIIISTFGPSLPLALCWPWPWRWWPLVLCWCCRWLLVWRPAAANGLLCWCRSASVASVGRVPAAASVGRRSVRRWRSVGPLVVSVGPSASLAAYVINTSVFVAERNAGNGPPWLVGVSPYTPTRRSAAFSRNFLFLFFYFGTRSPILDSWPFLRP